MEQTDANHVNLQSNQANAHGVDLSPIRNPHCGDVHDNFELIQMNGERTGIETITRTSNIYYEL